MSANLTTDQAQGNFSLHKKEGITEVAILPLKAGSQVDDPNTPAGSIVQDCIHTVLEQPGAQRAYFGTAHEDPTSMHWFVDWDSHDNHMQFTKSE